MHECMHCKVLLLLITLRANCAAIRVDDARAARRDRLEDVVQHLLRDLRDLRAHELRPLGHLRLVLGRRGLAQ